MPFRASSSFSRPSFSKPSFSFSKPSYIPSFAKPSITPYKAPVGQSYVPKAIPTTPTIVNKTTVIQPVYHPPVSHSPLIVHHHSWWPTFWYQPVYVPQPQPIIVQQQPVAPQGIASAPYDASAPVSTTGIVSTAPYESPRTFGFFDVLALALVIASVAAVGWWSIKRLS